MAWGWFRKDRSDHINRKDFKAGVLALQSYAMSTKHVEFYTESMVLYWYFRKWGGRLLHLNSIIKELWDHCQKHDLTITPYYVPSAENPADAPSRRRWTLADATLHKHTFDIIVRNFGLTPVCDWMADEMSAVCRRYISETPQPGAEAVDIFSMANRLDSISPGWLNPPWSSIPAVLQMISEGKNAVALMVVLVLIIWMKLMAQDRAVLQDNNAAKRLQPRQANNHRDVAP